MKNILILCLVLLTSCSRYGIEKEDFKNLPIDLVDCKFFRFTDIQGSQSLIARCPNSSTTTKSIDNKLQNIIVIDTTIVGAVQASSSVKEVTSIYNDFVGPLLKRE